MAQKQESGNLFLVSLRNMEFGYTAKISIAGQSTSVVLDTGADHLWVDPICPTAPRRRAYNCVRDSAITSPQYCESVGLYDPSSSSTAEAPGRYRIFEYADGSTVGIEYYADTIDIDGLTISKQQFGVAMVSYTPTVGIMGMGPSFIHGYNTSRQPYSLILDSMASQGQIESRAFSLNLGGYDDSTGSINFGGLDKKKFSGSLQTLPPESVQQKGVSQAGEEVALTGYRYVVLVAFVDPASYWTFMSSRGTAMLTICSHRYYVTVQSMGLTEPSTNSSSTYSQQSFLAHLESAATNIHTPKGLSSQICKDLDGSPEVDSRYGSIMCLVNCSVRDRPGGLDFDFDGKIIQVTYQNLLRKAFHDGTAYCILAVKDTPVATDPPCVHPGTALPPILLCRFRLGQPAGAPRRGHRLRVGYRGDWQRDRWCSHRWWLRHVGRRGKCGFEHECASWRFGALGR